MINEALTIITNEMNAYLNIKSGSDEEQVMLAALVNPDGSPANNTENKIIITLVNIEADATAGNNLGFKNPRPVVPAAHDNLNLYILITACYTNYNLALQCIYNAITFLQQKSLFTPVNTPGLTDSIEKITVQMVNLPMENVQQLWLDLGARYQPSAVFKIRVLLNTTLPV